MPQQKQYDYLINLLYDSILQPELWPQFLGRCGQFLGGVDLQLVTKSKTSGEFIGNQLAATHFSLEALYSYAEYYYKVDPRLAYFLAAQLGEWRFCHDVCDQSFAKRNEFYQDFLFANGAGYVMTGCVNDQPDRQTYMAVLRAAGQEPFGEEQRQLATQLNRHLNVALTLQTHTQKLQHQLELTNRTIDALMVAMFIVDERGKILQLNAEAEKLLGNSPCVISSLQGRLYVSTPKIHNQLQNLLINATSYPAAGGMMMLEHNQHLCSRQLLVIPLPPHSTYNADWQTPLAMVLILSPTNALSQLRILENLYRLTPAELRLLGPLVTGLPPKECADRLGISVYTVRTQLRTIFNKTQTRNQTELMKLLGNIPPFRWDS